MKKTLKWKLAQKLEKLWWKRYLAKKSPSDYLTWKKEYWQQFFSHYENTINLKTTDLIADLGCGPAGIFTIFKNNKVAAVDPLLHEYEKGLEVFNPNLYPNVEFVNSSLEEFEPNKKFNAVFCLNAINHVNNLVASFNKLSQITALGGYCLLSIDAHNNSLLKHLFRAIPGDALHPHQYDLKEYQVFFTDAGFELIDVKLYKTHPIFNYYVLLGKKTI